MNNLQTRTRLDEIIKRIKKKMTIKDFVLNEENGFDMSEIAKIPYYNTTYYINAEAITSSGEKRKIRMKIENIERKQIFVFLRNSRKYGFRYIGARDIASEFKEIRLSLKIDYRTPAERYIEEAYKYARYFEKYSHPNLWPRLREKIRNFKEKGDIESFLNDPDIKSRYDAWDKSRKYDNILTIETYKTTTLKTWGFTDHDIQLLKEAIENRKDVYVFSYKKYDATASIERDKGFLSLEYRGLGNGHYYILIDEQHALFEEDD